MKSIHLNEWPDAGDLKQKLLDRVHVFTSLIEIISQVRKWKTQHQKPMNSEIVLIILEQQYKILKDVLHDLKDVTNAREIRKGKQFRVEF